MLNKKSSEEHLQCSNESTKTKTKINKNKKTGTITQSTCQEKIEKGHSIKRVWYTALVSFVC